MGLVQDLLQGGGYIWSDCPGVVGCYQSGEDRRGTHNGIKEGVVKDGEGACPTARD